MDAGREEDVVECGPELEKERMDTHLTESCFRKMGGAYAALFTPYDAKGRVNPEMIAKVIDYGLANGLNGFYLTGTTGEWWLLSLEERKFVMEAAVRAAKGRCRLIAHVGANRTDDAELFFRCALTARFARFVNKIRKTKKLCEKFAQLFDFDFTAIFRAYRSHRQAR